MKAVELFAGVGGFRLGLERAGHEVIWANEWDKYAAQTYDKNFGGSIDKRSITDVRAEDIPAHDLIGGGFPCQAFSVAGKRRGFDETRGTLFFEIMRVARHHRTKYLFLENVKGLLSHDGGRTFETIIKTLDELGYDCQWQVLNSKDFGVPQNRERVFIIGHLRGQPRPQIFPLRGSDQGDNEAGRLHEEDHGRLSSSEGGQKDDSIAPTLASNRGGGSAKHPYIAKTVRAGGQKSPHGSKQNWDSYEVDSHIRRLTPLECERLQGFPDNWTAGVSDTQRYKQMGNAVTVNVIQAVAERMISQ